MAEDVGIQIRVSGGRQAAAEAKHVSSAIGTIGHAGHLASAGLGRLGSGMASLSQQVKIAGAGMLGLGLFTARAGIQFDAFQEQSQIAFTGLLGSTKAARRELGFLQQTAAKTPFELPGITAGARQLLAFGFNVRQANSLLTTMGDAAAGAGLGADAIDSMVRSIGQIRGKGTLQAEELQQLGELGIVNREKLAKNLGVTTAQLADAGNQGIGANKAIAALQKTLNQTFGGAAAKQSQTFTGQMSTLHDTFNQTAGILAKPAFDELRKHVLPALTDTATAIGKIGGRKDIDIGRKLGLSGDVARRNLGPFVTELEHAAARAHIGKRIGDGIEREAPVIGHAFGKAAPVAARAFWGAFKESGPAGQAAMLGIIGAKFGGFHLLGSAAGSMFAVAMARRTAANVGADMAGAGMAGKMSTLGGRYGRVFGVAAEAAIAVGIGRGLVDLSDQAGLLGGKTGRQHRANWVDEHVPGMRELRHVGQDLGLDPKPAPRRVPRQGVQAGTREAYPLTRAPGRPLVIYTSVQIDKKEIAKATHHAALDAHAARKGG